MGESLRTIAMTSYMMLQQLQYDAMVATLHAAIVFYATIQLNV